jgi:hypothetical protein
MLAAPHSVSLPLRNGILRQFFDRHGQGFAHARYLFDRALRTVERPVQADSVDSHGTSSFAKTCLLESAEPLLSL